MKSHMDEGHRTTPLDRHTLPVTLYAILVKSFKLAQSKWKDAAKKRSELKLG
jgi:hypothetical protein